jgi:hypothetical protein
MRGERWLLRVGEFLAGRAARHLPAAARDERYREWAAELPVILGDPEIKPAAARAARMLRFAADTLRGAALRPSWFSAGVAAADAGGGAARLAGQLGWGHPLLFTLIGACGYAVCAACISVAVTIVIRSAAGQARHPPVS